MIQVAAPIPASVVGPGTTGRVAVFNSTTTIASGPMLLSYTGGELTLSGTLTAARTWTIPNRALTIRGVSGTQTGGRLSAFDANGDQTDSNILENFTGGLVNFSGVLTGNRTYSFPNVTGTVALASTTLAGYGITDGQPLNTKLTSIAALANAAGQLTNDGAGNFSYVAAGGVTGSGTIGTIPKWTASGAIGNSLLIDNIGTGALTLVKTGVTARQATFPDASGTVPLLEAVQIWTGLTNTFRTANGLRVDSGATQDQLIVAGSGFGSASRTMSFKPVALSTSRVIELPDASGTVALASTTLAGYGITDAQPLDADLTAIAALATTGMVARTAANTWVPRTIASTSTALVVANGDGVAGAPSFSMAAILQALGVLANASGTLTNNGSGGLSWAASGGLAALFTGTADKTVGNTTTETTLVPTGVGSVTLAVNSLTVGKTITVKITGYIQSTAAATYIFKLKVGGVEVTNSMTVSGLTHAAGTPFQISFMFTCRSTGAGGTVVSWADYRLTGNLLSTGKTTTTTIDTTVTNAVDVTVQWLTANVLNTITTQIMTVESLS